ncbi:MAG: MaoC family dehydratase [Alcaligenaceae bacterium]|nr:MaoC family dehydratase [Alcaligenaceae bacterium]
MKFADLKPGMVFNHDPVRVEEDAMMEFSRVYDPQPFHIDRDRARESCWGGLIASGWYTCALTMRMAVDCVLADSDSFGSPGIERLRWIEPVRAGDTIRLEARIDTVRTSSKRSDLGIVRWTWRVFNQHDREVMELEATTLFELAGQS